MSESKLFYEYIDSYEKVMDLYPEYFGDESSWEEAIADIKDTDKDYNNPAEILSRQNLAFGSGQKAMENIEKLAEGSAYAVVTGQQVGIFTGPLYTIYKAMTAIKLAQYLHDRYHKEFVPIFWMESNDHDMGEANHINILDSEDDLDKIEYYPKQYTPGCSLKNVMVDDGFHELISDLSSRFPDTEFKNGVFDIIRESYRVSESISYGFGRLMAQLMGKYGLVLMDPSDPEIKKLMTPIFKRNIESPLEPTDIINSAGENLESRGYESQIEKTHDSTCLFIEEDGLRKKLFFRDEKFNTENGRSFDAPELLSILQNEPERFSPNVALRPVIQDYILPTVAYVAGPGEISYFAQLKGLYEYMNVNMPIIYPRASFTIIENKVERIMEKNGLEVADLKEDYNRLFSELSKDIAEEKLDHVLESSESELNGIFERLASDLIAFDPNMENIVESAKRKVDHQVNILKQKAYQSQRSRSDILRNQIKRACMNVYPDGKPQERVFNILQYLVYYGLGFLDDIMSSI
jgi:bacillithiol biosynthesis cysteine-adding enzyme BshC